MSEDRIATLVRRVEELAAVTPSTQAVIIALDHQAFNDVAMGLQEAFGEILGPRPWLIIVPGEVGLADSTFGHPEAGIFIGREQLSRLVELKPAELKRQILGLMKESA